MSVRSVDAPKTSVMDTDASLTLERQEKRTRRTLRWGAAILGSLLVAGAAYLVVASNSTTEAQNQAASSSQIADTNAQAAVAVADPVLALCAKSDSVATRLRDAGLCGTAANVRTIVGAAGAPGRDGIDGIDGRDGVNGIDGQPGTDGTNGIDGKNGSDGAAGTFPVEYTETRSDGRVKHCRLEPGSEPPNYQCTISNPPTNSTVPTS